MYLYPSRIHVRKYLIPSKDILFNARRKMQPFRSRTILTFCILIICSFCLVLPVSAANGTVSIYYRGSGGSYIGDSITFDGVNTLGNTTIIKINGPGLPVEGVPLYDLTGTPGSGNTIAPGNGGAWSFSWDTDRVVGLDLLQTARYTFTAMDQQHPGTTATTSIMLKKPEFYVIVTPNPSVIDDYVTLTGYAEKGVNYVQIDVTDANGIALHTFTAPVSADGYFQYGFHINMVPGQYLLQVSNPLLNNKLVKVLTVIVPATPTPALTANETSVPSTKPVTSSLSQPTQIGETPSLSPTITKSSSSIPLSPFIAIIGTIGAIAIFWSIRKKPEH